MGEYSFSFLNPIVMMQVILMIGWGNRTFDQASPNAIPVGSQADLSDLRIKSEKEDCKFSLSLSPLSFRY